MLFNHDSDAEQGPELDRWGRPLNPDLSHGRWEDSKKGLADEIIDGFQESIRLAEAHPLFDFRRSIADALGKREDPAFEDGDLELAGI